MKATSMFYPFKYDIDISILVSGFDSAFGRERESLKTEHAVRVARGVATGPWEDP